MIIDKIDVIDIEIDKELKKKVKERKESLGDLCREFVMFFLYLYLW